MNTKNTRAFTFVELIVVVTILTILSTIGFASITSYLSSSRDAERKTSFAQIIGAMKSHKTEKGSYPIPSDYFSISNGSTPVAWQGKFGSNIGLSKLDRIPVDPKMGFEYMYSITKNKGEFQIAGTLENEDEPKAILMGSYKSVSKNVLPTIILAGESTGDVDITDSNNKKLFIFDGGVHNLPYLFDDTNSPYSDGTDLSTLITEAENNRTFTQNSSYETCEEIRLDGKSIGDGNYELRQSDGSLSTTSCSGM